MVLPLRLSTFLVDITQTVSRIFLHMFPWAWTIPSSLFLTKEVGVLALQYCNTLGFRLSLYRGTRLFSIARRIYKRSFDLKICISHNLDLPSVLPFPPVFNGGGLHRYEPTYYLSYFEVPKIAFRDATIDVLNLGVQGLDL